MKGASAFVLGGFLAGCTHDEIDISTYVAEKVKAYEQVFVNEFGTINPEQDWGFGRAAGVRTRGAVTWNGVHTCFEANWENKLKNIKLPDGAFQLDQEGNYYYNQYGYPEPAYYCKIPNNVTVMYLSEDFDDELRMDGSIPAGAVLYNYGTVKGFSGNFNGTITIYNLGTMTYNPGSQDHNVYNTGTLYIKDNDACAKILNLYNTGYLEFGGSPAKLHSKSTYYSNGEGIYMPYGGDIDSRCDIHETITVDGDLNIQNGDTEKKICGIVASGKVQNTKGRLEVAYIEADDIYFEGNNIYLTPGAHLKANTMEFDKAACDVHAAAGSNALVEVTENIHFMNDNDFNRTFSDNIYFKIDGSIDMDGQTNGGFTNDDRILYNSADDYITKHGNPNNHLNAGSASGSPACGDAWTVVGGGPGEDGPGEDGEIQIPIEDPTITTTEITYNYWKTTQLIEQGRVFCEDLGKISTNDLDFNDVVFDAYIYKVEYSTEILVDGQLVNEYPIDTQYINDIFLLAAGGTIPLSVAGVEVHNALGGKATSTIINTIIDDNGAYGNSWATNKPVQLTGDYEGIVAIPIVIQYSNGTTLTLDASAGEAPHKICVPIGTPWAQERKKVDDAYLDFQKYVSDKTEFWNGAKDDSKLYHDIEYTYSYRRTGKELIDSTTERSSSSDGGYRDDLPVLARPRK